MSDMKNVTVRELVDLLNTDGNMNGASRKERILGLYVDGNHFGYITSAKLDGWGDGLITDVYLELNTKTKDVKSETNADKIRNMTNEELTEFLYNVSCNYSATCMMIDEDCKHFPNIPEDDGGCKDCFKEWLESECSIE